MSDIDYRDEIDDGGGLEFRLEAQLVGTADLARLPELAMVVDGLLYERTLAALIGPPGSFKSFTALHLAACIASGNWFAGREVNKCDTLYIAAEGSSGLWRRVQAWSQHHNVGTDHLTGLHWLPSRIDLLDDAWTAALIGLLDRRLSWRTVGGLNLIVIDTLNRCMGGGDENSSRDMGRVLDHLDQLRIATGACILLVHHTGKDPTKGGRGHSSLLGALDTELRLEGDARRLTLTTTKQKDVEAAAPIQLAAVPAADSLAVDHRLERLSGEDSGLVAKRAAELLEVLNQTAGSDGISSAEWIEMVGGTVQNGPGRSSFYEAKKTLEMAGSVQNLGSAARPRWIPVIAEDLI